MKCFYHKITGRCVIEAEINGKKITFHQKSGESLTQFLISVAGLTEEIDN